ncbi:hypothetical protein HDC92_000172 [Pedobacter sp. AK017]|uniref:hypothetical protein n=1 Tax=Pedobacter sp. AK017 TaxID=2723073 RepID=UPI0016159F7F|nr:hypothetical protein [Pedobacter sp. AK017]MBB5436508.1 hypothetical protein [Pedobacter sp. AK017]
MKKNESEGLVNEVNQGVFFKEFTFSRNEFMVGKLELELADHVVWMDDLFFIFQIKDRNPTNAENGVKWFQNKVINKAVKQIKNTLKYLEEYNHIPLINNKGHEFNLSDAKGLEKRMVIVYNPVYNFPDEKRNLKFYKSSQIGLVHLFHAEDYAWICKYLQTPAEIEEYLDFRENLFGVQGHIIVHLPEQYVLGHFLETLDVDQIIPRYINNVRNFKLDTDDFDISGIINNFTKSIRLANGATEYYPIIKEIAKLKRSELREFKKRFVKAWEVCKEGDLNLPYRMYLPRTDCAFIFIPLVKTKAGKWYNALYNYTLAHKYDQKAGKCVGVVIKTHIEKGENFIDMNWMYVEQEWIYDDLIEMQLKNNFPFRKVATKEIKNRYMDFDES